MGEIAAWLDEIGLGQYAELLPDPRVGLAWGMEARRDVGLTVR
jgi:hypothetical protein